MVDIGLEGIQYSVPFTDGNFSFAAAKRVCNDDSTFATIIAHDQSTGKQTMPLKLFIVPGNNISPAIFACEESPDEHITYLVNDTGYINFSDAGYDIYYVPTAGDTNMFSENTSGDQSRNTNFFISGKPDNPAYVPGVFNVWVDLTFNGIRYSNHSGSPSDIIAIPANIREYAYFVPGYTSGSFSGVLTDVTTSTNTISVQCEFRIKSDW